MGLVSVGFHLDVSPRRHCSEESLLSPPPRLLDCPLCPDGMDSHHHHKTAAHVSISPCRLVAGRRRHLLYIRNLLFPQGAPALESHHLACVRNAGKHLPLLCGLLLRF